MPQADPLKQVVVIGEKEDLHLPFVSRHLSKPLLVIDAEAIMAAEELSYSFRRGKMCITYKGQSLDSVTGVWLRGRRISSIPTSSISAVYRSYSVSSVARHIQALYAHLPKARWVSDCYAIRRAGYKPLQLQSAHGLGLKVPDTLFTSNAVRAQKFMDEQSAVIVKPIGIENPIDTKNDLMLKFFSTKIQKGEKIDLSGLPLAPAIFQQAIDAAADLRITVIGDKVFSAIIVDEKADHTSPTRDWRIGDITDTLRIEPYKLPRAISDKCLALVKELGLQYGAIDMVLDKKGNLWFLEINPNGQWAFIERATGQPLGRTLAELLQTPAD